VSISYTFSTIIFTTCCLLTHTANGQKMYPLGYLPVTFTIGCRTYMDNVHIYPNITKTILSWKAAKALAILPEHYPQPSPLPVASKHTPQLNVHAITFIPPVNSNHSLTTKFATVFDEQIRTMEGEKFHITLTANATPFCIKTPRYIPFAYRDKLKAELDLLLSQNVITPVTEPTEWCAPIVVTPKKTVTVFLCVLIFLTSKNMNVTNHKHLLRQLLALLQLMHKFLQYWTL